MRSSTWLFSVKIPGRHHQKEKSTRMSSLTHSKDSSTHQQVCNSDFILPVRHCKDQNAVHYQVKSIPRRMLSLTGTEDPLQSNIAAIGSKLKWNLYLYFCSFFLIRWLQALQHRVILLSHCICHLSWSKTLALGTWISLISYLDQYDLWYF